VELLLQGEGQAGDLVIEERRAHLERFLVEQHARR
jgi:hypothetical protein